jgi:GxxExxY protein
MTDPFDLEKLVTRVIDHGFHIHCDLGPGLLESVYETVLGASLRRSGLAVERQKLVDIHYDGMTLRDGLRIDLLIENRLIVELKSVERLAPVHSKQVLTYLRLTGRSLGLLMNFGAVSYRDGVRRVANNHDDSAYRRRLANP